MIDPTSPRAEYLDRLTDLLPPREVARVREDVESLILERAAAEHEAHPDLDPQEAERRALEALGPAEGLADQVVSDPLKISFATRRLFVRVLAVLFAGHLLLSVVLTAAGSDHAAIPGLLGPLPTEPFGAVFLAVLTMLLIDTGLMLLLFVALGTGRSERALRSFYVRDQWTRRGAIAGVVLLVLLAVILNRFLGRIFAVRNGDQLQPFLSTELMELVPFVNVVLALFAVRHLITLSGRPDSTAAAATDALACLAGVLLMIVASTQELVSMPADRLGLDRADVLDGLIERVLLLVFIVGALMLTFRFVRQGIRAWRLMRT